VRGNGDAIARGALDRQDAAQLENPFAHAEQTERIASQRGALR
jgi:hypothetical protein